MALCIGYTFSAIGPDGNPLSAGLVYSYYPGTLTPKVTYSNYALSTENTNPVVLDASGQAEINLNGPTKLVIKSANGSIIETVDDANGVVTTSDNINCTGLAVAADLTVGDQLSVSGNMSVGGNVDVTPGSDTIDFFNLPNGTHTVGGTYTQATSGAYIIANDLVVTGQISLDNAVRFYAAIATTYTTKTGGPIPNNSIFRDSADNIIKIKDNTGNIRTLY